MSGLPVYFQSVFSGVFILSIITILGFNIDHMLIKNSEETLHLCNFSLNVFSELVIEFVYNLVSDLLGKQAKRFLPLIATLFIFILFTNMSGLFPFLPPSSADFFSQSSDGLIVFVWYWYTVRCEGAWSRPLYKAFFRANYQDSGFRSIATDIDICNRDNFSQF